MAVKIYDSSAGAFKDAATPQIYDASTQAYKDSTGLVYDTSKGAWNERWGDNKVLWLYKDGDECRDVTGGWTTIKGKGTFLKNASSLNLEARENSIGLYIGCNKLNADLSKYCKMLIESEITYMEPGGILACMIYDNYSNCNELVRNEKTGAGKYILEVNISNVANGFPCIAAYKSTIYISKIWLEK